MDHRRGHRLRWGLGLSGSVAGNRGAAGKQPTRPVQDIESALDGVVAEVPVVEGDIVAVDDLLVRFDPRDAETRLQAARRNRDRLQSQIAINRVVLGEQDDARALTPNQQRQLEIQSASVQQRINIAADEAAARRPGASWAFVQSLKTAENIAERSTGCSGWSRK